MSEVKTIQLENVWDRETDLCSPWQTEGFYKVTVGGSYFYFYSGNIIGVLVARSVLDALLKRGSSVVMGCSDQNMGQSELERVR